MTSTQGFPSSGFPLPPPPAAAPGPDPVAPAAMPKDIATKLAADVLTVMADPAFKQKALEQGATADYQSPAQLGDKVKTDYTEWAKVIKASQIEAD